MGNCLNSSKNSPARTITLAAFGLDNAGKTSVVKAIKGDSLADVAPTVGFSSNRFKHDKCDVTMYDVGGGSRIRGIWKNYFAEIHGLLYVVDSTDKDRTEENRIELSKLLSHPRIQGKPVLLFLNKRDVDGAMDENDATDNLNLEPIVNANRCHCKVELCSASKGVGKLADTNLKNGFEWIMGYIQNHYEELTKKIDADVATQKSELDEEKQLRIERIKRAKAERGENDDDEIPEQPTESPKLEEDNRNEKIKSAHLPENGDVKLNGSLGNGQYKQLGENAQILASRSPAWVPENTGLGQSYDNSSVPTLPPISPGIGLRMPPAAPPPSRTDIMTPQRRISVESHNFNDMLPSVHAHPLITNGHIPKLKPNVPEPSAPHFSAPQSASSRNDDSSAELLADNPRKRRRQKRLGRFNKTVPANGPASLSESDQGSVDTPPPHSFQPDPNLVPKLNELPKIHNIKPQQLELPAIHNEQESGTLSEEAGMHSNWALAEDL